MFTYQKDTKSLFVAECGKKDFWREIRKSSTAFKGNPACCGCQGRGGYAEMG